jgi:hypothetical protein
MAGNAAPFAFFALFPLLWCAITYLIAWIGGWRDLADVYSDTRDFQGELFRMRSGTMRAHVGYNNCLTFGANRQGLVLKVFALFRPGHPPLFVPWVDIVGRPGKIWFFPATIVTFKRVPGVPLKIAVRLGRDLEQAAGGAFRVEPV